MAQMNVAANAITSAATHVEEAAYSAQVACTKAGEGSNAIEKLANTTASLVGELGPRLSTTSIKHHSVSEITPRAASTLETVQKTVQELTPTEQSALHSLSATSEAVGQNIPALVQSCQAAAVASFAGAAALAITAKSLKTIAVNSTRMVATKEASLVFRAADRVSNRAGATSPEKCKSVTWPCKTPKHAIEKVKAMRESGVLLKGKEVVYHCDVIVATCDEDIIEMPEGMGRFIVWRA
eukprot:SM000021S06486  [mRNA]  locus=s21:674004:675236:+ [translate_table: standard]